MLRRAAEGWATERIVAWLEEKHGMRISARRILTTLEQATAERADLAETVVTAAEVTGSHEALQEAPRGGAAIRTAVMEPRVGRLRGRPARIERATNEERRDGQEDPERVPVPEDFVWMRRSDGRTLHLQRELPVQGHVPLQRRLLLQRRQVGPGL